MASKLEELLQESVKEIERRKKELLIECEALEKTIKQKEDESNKRILHMESESNTYIAKANREADAKLNEAAAIRKSLEGSEETLNSCAYELVKVDTQRRNLEEDKKVFDEYMAKENEKLDDRTKALELREAKLDNA